MSQSTPQESLADTARRFAAFTLAGVGAGATAGACIAFLRSQHVGWYAATVGLNIGIVTITYMGAREVSVFVNPGKPWIASGASGATTGLLLGGLYGGVQTAISGAVILGGAALAGQYMVDRFEAWRQAEADRILGKTPAEGGTQQGGAGPESDTEPTAHKMWRWVGVERGITNAYSDGGMQMAQGGLEEDEAGLRVPGLRPRPPSTKGEAAEGVNLPDWLPVQRLDREQHLRKLKQRLADIDTLLEAHARAEAMEPSGDTSNRSSTTTAQN